MKMRLMLKSIGCLLTVVSLLQIAPCAFAHTTSQKGTIIKYDVKKGNKTFSYIGGEDIGWGIDENNHTNGTKIYYIFSSDDKYINNYKSLVISGAAKWNNTGVVTITNQSSSSGAGTIKTYNEPESNVTAKACNFNANSSGHLTSWEIQINRSYTITSTTIAHEFGHIIGLKDLSSVNSNKLMCGVEEYRTVSNPTNLDIWGAKVITGQHSSHTWGYKFYELHNTGLPQHVTYCKECNGYRCSSNEYNPIISFCNIKYKYHSTNNNGLNYHTKYCTDCNYSKLSICKCKYKYYSTDSSGQTSHVKYCTICNNNITISNCTYSYKYYGTTGQGVNSHVKYCTVCNHYSTVSECTYNSKNICTYCGIPKNTSPYSINPELE